jgi:purine catabolism regulator
MQTTVKDILALEVFANVNVIAGKKGLNREVSNVYFMEVPDIYKYIDENGLLLTTLFPIANDKEAIEQFIPKLVDQRLAGIAIKPGRYIDEIPPIMVEQANHFEFPLMLLPDEANLSSLANRILELLLGMKTTILEFRDGVHNKLMGLLLEGADLAQLVESLSQMIQAPAVLINQSFDLITSSLSSPHDVVISKPKGMNSHYVHDIEQQLCFEVGGKKYKGSNLLVSPIYASRECLGYLIVLIEMEKKHPNMVVALEQASLLSAFVFQREQAMQQKERNYLDSFIRDVINQKFQSQYEVIQKAKIFKWELDFPVILLNIEILDKEGEQWKELYMDILDSGVFEQIIAEMLNISIRKCKLMYYNNALVCFISVLFENRIEERLHEVCDRLIKYIKRKCEIGIGISNAVNHINQLPVAYEQAKQTVRISKVLMNQQSFAKHYHQIGVYKLIQEIHSDVILKDYVRQKLGMVIDHSNQKDVNLLETLAMLIQYNWNIQKTAKAMYIHYNTLRYRIDKLRELGVEIDNGFELSEIAVAYQIHLLLQAKHLK